MKRLPKGFTLIEILVAIGVIAILAAVVIVSLVALMVLVVLSFWIRFGSSPTAVVKRAWSEFQQWIYREPEADVLLPIKFDKQDHALSCEVADLKMVLAYRGITVSEGQLLSEVGVDPTQKQDQNGQITWGDPNKAFVGNVDGKMLQDGYGVYWSPITIVANKYRPARIIANGTATDVASFLAQGNPVIAWSYLGSGKSYQWQTPAGKIITGIYSEHPVVVRGFKGSEDAPQGFFVIDPLYGYKYLTTSDFMAHWSVFDHSGVVIY